MKLSICAMALRYDCIPRSHSIPFQVGFAHLKSRYVGFNLPLRTLSFSNHTMCENHIEL